MVTFEVMRPSEPRAAEALRGYFVSIGAAFFERRLTDDEVTAVMRENQSPDLEPPRGLLVVAHDGGAVLGCVALRLDRPEGPSLLVAADACDHGVMADRRPSSQPWLAWSGAALVAGFWISLVGVIQPSGLLEVAAVLTVALIAGLCAALVALGTSPTSRRTIPVRANRRPQAPSRMWDADAPGRPQPRAPGPRRSCD